MFIRIRGLGQIHDQEEGDDTGFFANVHIIQFVYHYYQYSTYWTFSTIHSALRSTCGTQIGTHHPRTGVIPNLTELGA